MVQVDILRRPFGMYLGIGIVLGAVALALALGKVSGLGVVLDVLIAATTFAAGFAARARGGHPAWSGAGVGAVYGIVLGIRSFFQKTTASELRSALEKAHRTSPVRMSRLLSIANSPLVHLGSLALTVIIFGVVGLIIGAIAGAIAGGREQQARAV